MFALVTLGLMACAPMSRAFPPPLNVFAPNETMLSPTSTLNSTSIPLNINATSSSSPSSITSSIPDASSAITSSVPSASSALSSNGAAYSPPFDYPLDTSLSNVSVSLSPRWQDAHARARDHLASWTLEEKVNLTTGVGWQIGRCVGNIPAIPSQGFPGLCLEDSPLGVRFADFVSAFPAGINVASTLVLSHSRTSSADMVALTKT